MPFITYSTYRKPTGGAGGASTNVLYQTELNILAQRFFDPISKTPLSENYYDEVNKILGKAAGDGSLTAAQRIGYLTKISQNQIDKKTYKMTHQDIVRQSASTMEGTVEDMWRSLWKNKDILRSGNLFSMADEMLKFTEMAADESSRALTEMQNFTTDKRTLSALEGLTDYLEEESAFWRGVQNFPEDYFVKITPATKKGLVENFQIKKKGDRSDKDGELIDVNFGGLPVYSKETETDDEGNSIINISGNKFKGDIKNGYTFDSGLSDKEEIDFSNITPMPFRNYETGTIFQSSQGDRFLVLRDDYSYNQFNKDMIPELKIDVSKAVPLTDEEIKEIEAINKVIPVTKQSLKEVEIKAKVEQAGRESLPEPSMPYRAGEFMGGAVRGFGPAIAEAGIGMGKGAVEIGKGIKKAEAMTRLPSPKERWLKGEERRKSMAEVAGRIFRGGKEFWKGLKSPFLGK